MEAGCCKRHKSKLGHLGGSGGKSGEVLEGDHVLHTDNDTQIVVKPYPYIVYNLPYITFIKQTIPLSSM